MLCALSSTRDYIRAEHKLHTSSKLFISQVILPQVMFFFSLFIFRGHSTREPAPNRVACFILRAYTGTGVSHSQHGNNRERFWKTNAGEWTGRVEISKEEISGSKRSMNGHVLTSRV